MMKDWAQVFFVVVGFVFGMIFEQRFRQYEKIEAMSESQTNTTEIIKTSQTIKNKVEHHEDKNCVDIFRVDISECVQ